MARPVRAFEVHLNGKKVCLAGIHHGIVAITTNWVARPKRADEIGGFAVGGLIEPMKQHVRWANRKLRVGDELRIRVVERDAVDRPRKLKSKRRT